MNPARDVEYPDILDVPDEPHEPDIDDDEDPEIPAEHALDKDDVPDSSSENEAGDQ